MLMRRVFDLRREARSGLGLGLGLVLGFELLGLPLGRSILGWSVHQVETRSSKGVMKCKLHIACVVFSCSSERDTTHT